MYLTRTSKAVGKRTDIYTTLRFATQSEDSVALQYKMSIDRDMIHNSDTV